MSKAQRVTLNEKPLSRKETLKLAAEEGILHERYSEILTDRFNGKIVTLRRAYTLPGDRILYIRDVEGKYDGKGDIFTAAYFEKFVNHLERMKADIAHGRTSNIAHWHFYSVHQTQLIARIPRLLKELVEGLDMKPEALDLTPASLDLLSTKIRETDMNRVLTTLYDHLVAYTGEVMRKHAKGAMDWALEPDFHFPVIATRYPNVSFNPVNLVWEELTSMQEVNFRKAYGKELRQVGSRLSFEDHLSKNTA